MFKLSNRCSPVNCFCIATQYILSIDEWEKDNEQTTKLSIRNVEIPVRLVVLIFKHFKILILSFKKTPNNKKKKLIPTSECCSSMCCVTMYTTRLQNLYLLICRATQQGINYFRGILWYKAKCFLKWNLVYFS